VYNNTLSDCYFDNRDKYWMKNDRGDFDSSSKDMFIRELAVMGFSRAVSKGETSSPVEQIMTRIKATNRVTDTVSYVYHNQGMYKRRNGERVLNISTVKVTDPKAGPPLFREGAAWNSKEVHDAFPFIYEVITGLFQSSVKCMKGEKLCTQLEYFISWLSYFYSRSYEFKPSPGQALFICGPSNSGKTFTSRVIVGNLMGGFSEAKDYFKGTSEWNNDVNKAGVLVVDDDEGSSNHQMARTFQARVKAYVANGVVRVKQKYHDASDVPLMNRLIVTLNDSPADKQILPGLDETIKDKVSFLLLPAGEERTWRTPMQGATMEWGKNEELVVRELPAFAKWLYEYEIPEYLKDDRFGTKSLQHAKLSMSFSLQTGFGQEVIEALEILFRNTGEGFSGTATELLAALESVSSTLKRNVNPKQLSRSLMSLEADGFEIKVTTVKSLTNYTMEPDMLEKWAEQHKELDGSNT